MRNFNYRFTDSNIMEILVNHPQTNKESIELTLDLAIVDLDFLNYKKEEVIGYIIKAFDIISNLAKSDLTDAQTAMENVLKKRFTKEERQRFIVNDISRDSLKTNKELARVIFTMMLYIGISNQNVNEEVAKYLDQTFNGLIDKDNYESATRNVIYSIKSMMN